MRRILRLHPPPQLVNNETFLLDEYPGASLALSTRKLSSSAINCARVFRGGNEIDIGFDVSGYGELLGGDEIIAFYDQSGNALDFEQISNTSRPLATISDTPSILFDGVNDFLSCSTLTSNLFAAQDNTLFFHLNHYSGNNGVVFFGSPGAFNDRISLYATLADLFITDFPFIDRYNVPEPLGWNDSLNKLTYTKQSTGTEVFANGISIGSNSVSTPLNLGNITTFDLGTDDGGNYWKGEIKTLLIYPSLPDRLGIENLL